MSRPTAIVNDMLDVTINLKSLLERHDLSVYRLAQVSGISRQALYAITSTKSTPKAIELKTLAKIVTALEMLTGLQLEPNDLITFEREGGE